MLGGLLQLADRSRREQGCTVECSALLVLFLRGRAKFREILTTRHQDELAPSWLSGNRLERVFAWKVGVEVRKVENVVPRPDTGRAAPPFIPCSSPSGVGEDRFQFSFPLRALGDPGLEDIEAPSAEDAMGSCTGSFGWPGPT